MRIINEKELEGKTIQLHKGKAESKTLLSTSHMLARLLFIEPNVVCLPESHIHERREVLYVVRGTATFSDGEMTKEVGSGDMMICDPYDKHFVTSGPDGVVLHEVFEVLE